MSSSSKYWKKSPKAHSRAKSEIVAAYFNTWGKIMKSRSPKLAYLDLYAGRGRHDSGEPSTAITILEEACKCPDLRQKLVAVLNDVKPTYVKDMKRVVDKLEYNTKFLHKPKTYNLEVNDLLAKKLSTIRLVPTFCFIDPYGYKGLSLELIKAVIKDWGSDCIVFFYTSGIIRNVVESESYQYMRDLFGESHFSQIQRRISSGEGPRVRIVLEEFKNACMSVGCSHSCVLRFNFPDTGRLSHHLMLLTKHRLGFRIGKDVMAKYSIKEDGLPTFVYTSSPTNVGDQTSLAIDGVPFERLKKNLVEIIGDRHLYFSDIVDDVDDKSLLHTEKCVRKGLKSLEVADRLWFPASSGKSRSKFTYGKRTLIALRKG